LIDLVRFSAVTVTIPPPAVNYTDFLGILLNDIPAAVGKNVWYAVDFYIHTLDIVLGKTRIVVDCVPRDKAEISYVDWLLDYGTGYNEFEMKVKTIACLFVGLLQIQNQSSNPKQQLTIHKDGVRSPKFSKTATKLSRVCLLSLKK
jgi:hypothetical protein